MKNTKISDLLVDLAMEAGRQMRAATPDTMRTGTKGDGTPVTDIDIAINNLVVNEFAKRFPDVSVIGEELSNKVKGAKLTVVVDPIDGTAAFTRGVPISTFCASVLESKTGKPGSRLTPVYGVIYDPFCNRLWSGWKGVDAPTMNGTPIGVSSHPTLAGAKICIPWWKGASYNMERVYEALTAAGAFCVMPEAIAHYGGLVADGTIDATVFPASKALETTAMQVLVEQAGGTATDIFGRTLVYDDKLGLKGHVISNGRFHDALIKAIKSVNGRR